MQSEDLKLCWKDAPTLDTNLNQYNEVVLIK
jgi:hypothetical protein